MSNQNNKDQNIKELKKSPVYAMSLGSHELFHSNLWAWLMTNYPQSINAVFGFEVKNVEKAKILREAQNIDITIDCDGEKYIIENKFKSIPYKSQLVGYETKLVDKFDGGILTCIEEPNFEFNKDENWQCILYSDILNNMKEFAENITDDVYKNILREYIEVTRKTIELIQNELKKEENNKKLTISAGDFKDYEELRIADILRKLQAGKFESYIKEKLGEVENLYISSDYSNKNAIINLFFLEVNGEGENKSHNEIIKKSLYNFAIGVQIEGTQFRVVVSSGGGNQIRLDELFNKYKDKGWFDGDFDKTKTSITLLGENRKTSMSPKNNNRYNKYETGKYKFVYQYFNIEDNNFETVTELLKVFLAEAQTLFKSRNEQ